jgi:hypothetical protein
MTKTFFDSFFDGFGPAGLFFPIQSPNFLRSHPRSHRYETAVRLCATICLLAMIGSLTYLVMRGHYVSASAVFGIGVLTIVGKMMEQRLQKK